MEWHLFLDDKRIPTDVTWIQAHEGRDKFLQIHEWYIARTVDEAVEVIETLGTPASISFDHDLGKNQPTGYDLAKWIVYKYWDEENGEIPFQYFVHSKNPVGKENIHGLLESYIDFLKEEQ